MIFRRVTTTHRRRSVLSLLLLLPLVPPLPLFLPHPLRLTLLLHALRLPPLRPLHRVSSLLLSATDKRRIVDGIFDRGNKRETRDRNSNLVVAGGRTGIRMRDLGNVNYDERQ